MHLSSRASLGATSKALVALVVVVLIAACTPSSPAPQRTSSVPGSGGPGSSGAASPGGSAAPSGAPGTIAGGDPPPSGGPIVAVDDYLLPPGLGIYSPPEGDYDLALDDLTDAIFFPGVQVSEDTGEPKTEQGTSEAIYRFDPTSRQATKVAGTTLGAGAEVYGVAATNGWVFWTELLGSTEGPDGAVTTKCQAAKADGSGLITLEEFRGVRTDYAAGCAFSAGGATALWFGRWEDLDTMNVFDTRSGKKVKVSTSPPIPGFAKINDDVVLMYGHPAARSIILVHVSSLDVVDLTAEPPTPPDLTTFFEISKQVVAWTEDTGSASKLFACRIDTADLASTCSAPVKLGEWSAPFDPTSGMVGLAGGYVVMNPPEDGAKTVLISAQNPDDQTPIPGVIVAAGQRLAGVWQVRRAGDSTAAPPTNLYLRVITLA